jgi:phage-related protein
MSVRLLLSRVGVVHRAIQSVMLAAIGAACRALANAQKIDGVSPTDSTGGLVAIPEGGQSRGRLLNGAIKVNGHDGPSGYVLRPVGAILGEHLESDHALMINLFRVGGFRGSPYYGWQL